MSGTTHGRILPLDPEEERVLAELRRRRVERTSQCKA
jgi:hypothetical protein